MNIQRVFAFCSGALLLFALPSTLSATELGPGLASYAYFQREVQAHCGTIVDADTAIEMSWQVTTDGTATEIEIRNEITPQLKACILDALARTPFQVAENAYTQTFTCTIRHTPGTTLASSTERKAPEEELAEDPSIAAAEPPSTAGRPKLAGAPDPFDEEKGLTRNDIIRTVKANQQRLTRVCGPFVEERTLIKVRWTIHPQGYTSDVQLKDEANINPQLGQCVLEHARALRFPEAKASTQLVFPFRVQPKTPDSNKE